MVAEALECLGGNGYVEENGLARLYREAPLNSIWEGSGNVNALDVVRALTREPASLAALGKELALARGHDRVLDAAIDDCESAGALALGPDAPWGARRLVERLALTLQARAARAALPRAGRRRVRRQPARRRPRRHLRHPRRLGRAGCRVAAAGAHGSAPPGRRADAVVSGAGAGPSPAATRVTRTAPPLKAGCFDTGSHAVTVSWFAAREGRSPRSASP